MYLCTEALSNVLLLLSSREINQKVTKLTLF